MALTFPSLPHISRMVKNAPRVNHVKAAQPGEIITIQNAALLDYPVGGAGKINAASVPGRRRRSVDRSQRNRARLRQASCGEGKRPLPLPTSIHDLPRRFSTPSITQSDFSASAILSSSRTDKKRLPVFAEGKAARFGGWFDLAWGRSADAVVSAKLGPFLKCELKR